MSINLEGRVVLVTGAARGLGFAYSKCLIDIGATVAMQDSGVHQNGLNPDPNVIHDAAEGTVSSCK